MRKKSVLHLARKRSGSSVSGSSQLRISVCLHEIERVTFNFASGTYVQLKYGDSITDIWTIYRKNVEVALNKLDLTNHLQAIQSGLQSENPELWRTAVLEYRNMLSDVANYLWKDPRPTYEHLSNRDHIGKMDVYPNKYANRLAAYLHQKGMTGIRGRYVRDEVERIAASIRSLVSFQAEAHDPIELVDARSVALGTYFILGELR